MKMVNLKKSPAYYLKQNDVVYVQPNSVRAGQSTINISIASGVNGVGTGDMATFLGIISLSLDKYDPEMPVNILSVPLMTDKEKEQ